MKFPDITTSRFRLRACATTRKFCVVCQRDTDKEPAQVFVRDDDGRETGDVVCPECLQALPTVDQWQHLRDAVDAWDGAETPKAAQ